MRFLRAPRTVLALTTWAVVALVVLVVTPSPLGAQDPAPDDTTATEAPPDTAPEETVPDDTTPDDTGDDDTAPDDTDDDGSSTWLLAVVIAVVAVVVLGLVAQLLTSGRRSEPQVRRDEQRGRHDEYRLAVTHPGDDRLRRALGGAEWAHDQLTVEILAGGTQSPERLQRSWDESRRRLNDLGAEINALALELEPGAATDLQNLGHVVGLLIGAVDTNVDLRIAADADPEPVTDALRASNAAVEARRAELAAAIARARRLL